MDNNLEKSVTKTHQMFDNSKSGKWFYHVAIHWNILLNYGYTH